MLTICFDQPHRRFNTLTGEWVFVSPRRTKCPWAGTDRATRAVEQPKLRPAMVFVPRQLPHQKKAEGAAIV